MSTKNTKPTRPDPNNAAANQSFITDIEDSVRHDEMIKLWKEYGPYLIAGIVLAIIITATMSVYRSWDNKVNAQQTSTVLAALDSPDVPAALANIANTLRPGQRAVAMLTEGSALLQAGKNEEAAAAFEKAAEDKTLPPLYRDLALLEGVRLRTGQNGDTNGAAPVLLKKLEPVLNDPKNPWYLQAQLQAGVISAHDQRYFADAPGYLAKVLEAKDAPPALVEKAKQLDHVYELQRQNPPTSFVAPEPERR